MFCLVCFTTLLGNASKNALRITMHRRFQTNLLLLLSGVDELKTALQQNYKPVVAAVVNVNNYEQRSSGKQLPVDQQGGEMGVKGLTQ